MQLESKKMCYEKAEQFVKAMKNTKFISDSENKKNLEFVCAVGDVEVEYNLRTNTDLLTIRGTKKYVGLTDSELTSVAQEMLQDEKYVFTAYNERIIFQLSIPSVNMHEDAENYVNSETEHFFMFLNRIAVEQVMAIKT